MSAPFQVRRLRASDLDRIQEIEHACFGKDAYDRKLFAEYSRHCGDLFLVAVRGGRICGYALTCIRAGTGSAEVISIAVEPAARRHGAASVLLASTVRRLRRRRVPRLTLMVKLTNHPARRFYKRWGFQRVRRVAKYYEDGNDGIRMALEL